MQIAQYILTDQNSWKLENGSELTEVDLVIVFGQRQKIESTNAYTLLKQQFANAQIIGCTSAGDILNTKVLEESVVATAIKLEKSTVVSNHIKIKNSEESFEAGKNIIAAFNPTNLKHIFVLTDGLEVNGSQMVLGMKETLPDGVGITGGLASDGADFGKTEVFTHNIAPETKIIAAVGFYGEDLHFSFASMGGWDSFGIERLITKSKNNILYEIDGEPALDLYKSFLGDQAANLPASGLLFPLSIRINEGETPIVRTILGINEKDKSMTFAGDVPEGCYVRLMKANIDRLIDGSEEAAENCMAHWEKNNPELAILISCVGRKLVLKQMVEEEIETAKDKIGENTAITGFYSYGEISPFMKFMKCELHNQTMTITLISEN